MKCAIVVPAKVAPNVPATISRSAGMLMKAGIWDPSIVAATARPTNETTIPMMVLAFIRVP